MDHNFHLPSTAPAPVAPPAGPLAVGFWTRAKASIIDGVITSTIAALVNMLTGAFPAWPAWAWVVGAISLAVAPVYYIWAYSTGGQTLGKKEARIKVVSIDGSPLTWRTGLLRTIGYALSDFCFSLGYLWSIWDEDKQTWHDKLARTRVVPVSATDEQVRVAFNQRQLRKRSNRWKWVAGGTAGLQLALLACFLVATLRFPATQPPLHEDEWERFQDAVFARVNPDARIPNLRTSRTYDWNSEEVAEVWLEMEVTYNADCEIGSTSDWCYRLANELVGMVFANYPHIDEIDGIHLVMTKRTDLGIASFEITPVDDALTISEWRKRLSIPGP